MVAVRGSKIKVEEENGWVHGGQRAGTAEMGSKDWAARDIVGGGSIYNREGCSELDERF